MYIKRRDKQANLLCIVGMEHHIAKCFQIRFVTRRTAMPLRPSIPIIRRANGPSDQGKATRSTAAVPVVEPVPMANSNNVDRKCRSNKSVVWKYFHFLHHEDGMTDRRRVQCSVCRKAVAVYKCC